MTYFAEPVLVAVSMADFLLVIDMPLFVHCNGLQYEVLISYGNYKLPYSILCKLTVIAAIAEN